MPHTVYTADELERLHPSLSVPPDEPLDDLQNDSRDVVFQHGLRISEQILQQTSVQGRRRRPAEESRVSQEDAPEAPATKARVTTQAGDAGSTGRKQQGIKRGIEHRRVAFSKEECLAMMPCCLLCGSTPGHGKMAAPSIFPPRLLRTSTATAPHADTYDHSAQSFSYVSTHR